jgi:hypothetical protein
MTECERVRADAPGLAALPSDDAERAAAWAHAKSCEGCARALREAERLRELIAGCASEPLPAGALERSSRAIGADLRREARWRAIASIAAVCASAAVILAFARDRSRSADDWALAGVLGALAVALAAVARRAPMLVAALAGVGALLAAAASGGPGPLAPRIGVDCLAAELGSAAAVMGAAWLALRGGSTSPARSTIAAAAASGALAGDAALQVTCAAHTSVAHLLAFHVGGVLLATTGAALLWRAWQRAPA